MMLSFNSNIISTIASGIYITFAIPPALRVIITVYAMSRYRSSTQHHTQSGELTNIQVTSSDTCTLRVIQ
uniref:Uncharacterized protein n=1 Tax=viral metagenome TaxID=1070528 RepID=A0A6C0BME0_9ZZZZ